MSGFDKIMEGLNEALDFANGKDTKAVIHVFPDIKAIRSRAKLSQAKFAKAIHVSTATLQEWEQGRRIPTGGSATLLKMLEADTEGTMKILEKID